MLECSPSNCEVFLVDTRGCIFTEFLSIASHDHVTFVGDRVYGGRECRYRYLLTSCPPRISSVKYDCHASQSDGKL